MRRAGGAAVFVALAIAAIAAPSAAAAPANIMAGGPGGTDVFDPTTYSHDAGTLASMTWVGGGAHNVTASANGPDGDPLFRSATISGGATFVNGTQYVQLGSYPFSCTIHAGMNGTLNVNAGTPQARPSAQLALKSKSLKQVLKSEEIKVKVTMSAPNGERAKLQVKLGKKKLTGTVFAASSRVAKIGLTNKGIAALEKKTKATVTATASIEFGEPDTAKKSLK
jgi:plastocyanin